MGVTETLQHLQKKYSKDVAMRTTLSRTGHGGRAKSTESYFALLNHPHPINNVHYYRLEQRPVPTPLPHCCERAKGIDPYGKGRKTGPINLQSAQYLTAGDSRVGAREETGGERVLRSYD